MTTLDVCVGGYPHGERKARSRCLMVLLAAAVVALSACGGGDEEGDVTGGSGSGGGGSQSGLSISGNPPSSVLAGTSYSFTPAVSNPNGGTLTFTVSNLPSWATLNSSTGRVIGTPQMSDVRQYTGITMTVTNGSESVSVGPFSIEVVGTATGSATLTWTAPTTRTDGTSLSNLAGYRIYWGTAPDALDNMAEVDNPGISSYVIDQLTPATWHFVATAFDANNRESAFSNMASKTIQ